MILEKATSSEASREQDSKISTTIRIEQPEDFTAIKNIVTRAFGKEGPNVAKLVENIRASENYIPQFSLVAKNEAGEIVGHIMLSYAQLQDGDTLHRVLTLSPLAVAPEEQDRGIGGMLVRAVTSLADQSGAPLVVLEGSPKYYSRFGFEYSVPLGVTIDLPSWAPAEASQVLKLSSYDPSIRGTLIYPPAFDSVAEEK